MAFTVSGVHASSAVETITSAFGVAKFGILGAIRTNDVDSALEVLQ